MTASGMVLGFTGLTLGASRDRARHRVLVYGSKPDALSALTPKPPVESLADLWSRVMAGDTIDVLDSSGRKATGMFEEASGSAISFRVNGEPRRISANDVKEIRRHTRGGWVRVLSGAAVGAALLGIGPAIGGRTEKAHPIVGAFIGSGLGAGLGSLVPRRTVVFTHQRREARIRENRKGEQ